MDRPWEPFDRARRVLRGRDDLVGWKSADLPSVGDDAVVPTYCFEIKEVIGMRFADPERLVGKKRRNELAAAETSLCYLTRGKFGEDQNDDGFIDTRWVELEELYDNCGKQNLNRALKAYRTAEKKAADEAIVGFEEDDE